MKILSKCHSSYPRIGDQASQQKLRRALNAYDRQKIGDKELAVAIDETVTEIIREQLNAGADIVTDAQVRAYDPISHIAAKIDGFEIGGLLRFFDTNYYYRQPKIVSSLAYRETLVAADFAFAREIGKEKASAVLFGPYSLLKMSMGNKIDDKKLDQLLDIYTEEMRKLSEAGACLVQFDEPAIIQHQNEAQLFLSAYKKLCQHKGQLEILMALYFGDAAPVLGKLAEIPVDGMVFDFMYSAGLEAHLNGFSGNIGLGIIDGRNTKMESANEIAVRAEAIIKKTNASKAYITTSCGLEFLPRDRAFAKQKLCADAADMLRGAES